jgi:hypothetical protein
MSRSGLIAILALLVLALSWQVCCGCSAGEGTLTDQYTQIRRSRGREVVTDVTGSQSIRTAGLHCSLRRLCLLCDVVGGY